MERTREYGSAVVAALAENSHPSQNYGPLRDGLDFFEDHGAGLGEKPVHENNDHLLGVIGGTE